MKHLLRVFGVIGITAMAQTARAEILIDTDFSREAQVTAHTAGNGNDRVDGSLPKGWMDDSAWAPTWVTYGTGDEQGTRFLRMNATTVEDGRPQLACYPLPDATGERIYRLTIVARNLTSRPVTFGLRMRERPWKFYWSRTEKLSRNWETKHYEFRLRKNDQSMGLWFNLASAGEFHLQRIHLGRFSEMELIDEVKRKYPNQGPVNLLRTTRFPLGLPNGWSIDRDCSDGDVVTIASGGPADPLALRIHSPEPVVLRGEPFTVAYPIATHTFAFSAKGEGTWSIQVYQGGKTFGNIEVSLSNEWQRISLAFEPRMGIPFYQVRFSGTGTISIDKLQAGPKDKVDDYTPAHPAEVALTVPRTYEAAGARIMFADEVAPVIRGMAFGNTSGCRVRSRLVNVYGDTADISPVSPRKDGSFALNLGSYMGERSLGSFRIEAWAETDGVRRSAIAELIFHRLKRPRYWGKDAPNSPFAIHTNSTTRHILMAKAAGINWTRLHDAGLQYFGWWNLEPEKGKWQFFDRELKRFRHYGVKIFAELGTAPPWASYYHDTGRKTFGYFDKFFQPKDLDDYRNYVATVCERYRNDIDAFDVWNEPWIHAWWGVAFDHEKGGRAGYITSKEPQKDFAALMQVARDTTRSIIPKAMVFGINTTTGKGGSETRFGGDEWTAGVVDAGGMEHCDGIAYHAYTGGGVGYPGDSVETGLDVAVGAIRNGDGTLPKPIWMTEGSPIIHRMGNGLYKHTLAIPPEDDISDSSNRLARYLVSMLANGVSRIFLYSMHSHGSFETKPKQWNALTTDEGYLHPAGAAHSHIAWLLEDMSFRKRISPVDGVHAYIFTGTDRAVAAISSSPQHSAWVVPEVSEGRATDLFGNPVTPGTAFTGNMIYIQATDLETLQRAVMPR